MAGDPMRFLCVRSVEGGLWAVSRVVSTTTVGPAFCVVRGGFLMGFSVSTYLGAPEQAPIRPLELLAGAVDLAPNALTLSSWVLPSRATSRIA